jgi:hypothetical protein
MRPVDSCFLCTISILSTSCEKFDSPVDVAVENKLLVG